MKYIYLLIFTIFISSCSHKTAKAQSKFIISGESQYNIENSLERMSVNLKKKNYSIVSVFDHEKEAIKLKEMLYPTKTINFYNSKIATKMISCNPSISMEFPIRVSLYNKIDGTTYFAYTDPEYWSLKHNIKDSECLKLIILIKQDLQEATSLIKKKKE